VKKSATNAAALQEPTYLVQRLTKPWPRKNAPGILGPDNPFAFGGGYKNGGLSDDAMELLRPCFGFDYMGSAEYEFGAVPKALQKVAVLADEDNLAGWQIEVDKATIYPGWLEKNQQQTGMATVYVLGDRRLEQAITERIQWIAMEHQENPHPEWGVMKQTIQFKESANFGFTLLSREYTDRNGGWLELDNGFLFFTDEQMWARTAAIFGVQTGVEIESDE
jgi:hypothetical protein